MCGIHLIIDKQASLSQAPIRQMQQALQHRGPDAASNIAGIRTSGQTVFMALNRLRITDLRTEADQLIQSADGRYTLAYNGAIYNYREIRKSLESKYQFRTNTDTEVLFHLLLEKGAAGLEKVNGMFAFAWYDRQEEKLLVCRDRFGMKPLFYTENEKFLVISSEIKGILASGLVKKELNTIQIPHYLTFKFAQRPSTFYQAIFEIMPGRLYTAHTGQTLADEAPLPSFKNVLSGPVTLPQIENTLLASLERHITAEVPVGLFLSGGVDSTLLLAMSRELGMSHLPVFSVVNAPEEANFGTRDYHYARLAARQYGADYYPLEINSGFINQDHFSEFVGRIDQPVADGAAWLTLLLSQEAKKHTTVILSGAGADELFAGYHRHWAYYQYLQHYTWMMRMLPLLKKMPAWLPTGFTHPLRKHFRLLRKMALQIDISPEQTFINFTALLQSRQKSESQASQPVFPPPDPSNYLKKALCYDQDHFLSADILMLTDRMTMQAGIEARLPYLDVELVTSIEAVDAAFLLENGRKWILNEFLAKRGGKPYIQRTKEGFGMPFGKWLKTEKTCYLIKLLKNTNSAMYEVLLYEDVMQMLQAHLSGKIDYSSELWALVLLAAWIEKEFGKNAQ